MIKVSKEGEAGDSNYSFHVARDRRSVRTFPSQL